MSNNTANLPTRTKSPATATVAANITLSSDSQHSGATSWTQAHKAEDNIEVRAERAALMAYIKTYLRHFKATDNPAESFAFIKYCDFKYFNLLQDGGEGLSEEDIKTIMKDKSLGWADVSRLLLGWKDIIEEIIG
jgi:hypothetical protein